MYLREYLETLNQNSSITFIVAHTVRDKTFPGFTTEFKTTPIRNVSEWLDYEVADKYIILNLDHPPIDITGGWVNWYNKGILKCCVISTEKDIYTRYTQEQGNRMISYYDKETRLKLNATQRTIKSN